MNKTHQKKNIQSLKIRVLTKVLKGLKLIFPFLRPYKVLNFDILLIKVLIFMKKVLKKLWINVTACC